MTGGADPDCRRSSRRTSRAGTWTSSSYVRAAVAGARRRPRAARRRPPHARRRRLGRRLRAQRRRASIGRGGQRRRGGRAELIAARRRLEAGSPRRTSLASDLRAAELRRRRADGGVAIDPPRPVGRHPGGSLAMRLVPVSARASEADGRRPRWRRWHCCVAGRRHPPAAPRPRADRRQPWTRTCPRSRADGQIVGGRPRPRQPRRPVPHARRRRAGRHGGHPAPPRGGRRPDRGIGPRLGHPRPGSRCSSRWRSRRATPTGGEHGYDYWQVDAPHHQRSRRSSTTGSSSATARRPATSRTTRPSTAARGSAVLEHIDATQSWQIDVYDPAFTTPAGPPGRPSTRSSRTGSRTATRRTTHPPTRPGTTGADRYRYGDVYGNPSWSRPGTTCRRATAAPTRRRRTPATRARWAATSSAATWPGITAASSTTWPSLGVTVIYLNPIFAAPSNHRYDTSDYLQIDPDLGTQDDFDALVARRTRAGIRVLLDGVFNHVSSDSPCFDRARRYPEVGACESADSAVPRPGSRSGRRAASRAMRASTGRDTTSAGSGSTRSPCSPSDPAVFDLFTGPDGVVRHWLAAGIAGWRLDVMDDLSHGVHARIRAAR